MIKSRGFSLVELMVVIGVVSTLSVVAVYSWQGYQDNLNLRTAARDIATDIEACKQRAVSEGIQYRLTFVAGANSYTIAPDPFTVTQTKSLTAFGLGLSIISTNFAAGQWTFLLRGTLSGPTGKIVVGNSKGSRANITVNITGRTHVEFTMQ